jgi:hypothetical protein
MQIFTCMDDQQMATLAIIHKPYTVEAIRPVLVQVAQGNLERSVTVAEEQLKELAETTHRCVKATAALWAYLEESSP